MSYEFKEGDIVQVINHSEPWNGETGVIEKVYGDKENTPLLCWVRFNTSFENYYDWPLDPNNLLIVFKPSSLNYSIE